MQVDSAGVSFTTPSMMEAPQGDVRNAILINAERKIGFELV
jgi:hypothetical protein